MESFCNTKNENNKIDRLIMYSTAYLIENTKGEKWLKIYWSLSSSPHIFTNFQSRIPNFHNFLSIQIGFYKKIDLNVGPLVNTLLKLNKKSKMWKKMKALYCRNPLLFKKKDKQMDLNSGFLVLVLWNLEIFWIKNSWKNVVNSSNTTNI